MLVKIKKVFFFLVILFLPAYIVRFKILGFPTTLLEVSFACLFLTAFFELVTSITSRNFYIKSLKAPIFTPMALFVVAGVVAVFASPDQYRAFGAFRAYVLEPIVLFLITSEMVLAKELSIVELIKYLIFTAVPIALLGLYQFFTGTNWIAPLEAAQGRVTAFFNHPNFLAMYLGPIIILTYYQIRQKRNYLIMLFFLLSLLVFILTKSRGGLIALICSFGTIYLVTYYQRSNLKIKKIIRGILFVFITLFLIGLVWFFLNLSLFTPKNKLVWPRPNPQTSVVRLCVWEGTINLLKQSPLLGTGLAGFSAIYPDFRTCDTELFAYPHNIFLNFWTEMGLLGLISFLYLLIKATWVSGRLEASLHAALIGVFIYWLVHGLVDVPYIKNDLSMQFWLFMVIAVWAGPMNSLQKDLE